MTRFNDFVALLGRPTAAMLPIALSLASAASAGTGMIAAEGFDYLPIGSPLVGQPPGGSGWDGGWAGFPSWTIAAPSADAPRGGAALLASGNAISASSAVGIRALSLAEPLGNSPATVWLSILAQRVEGDSDGSFLGLNLLAPGGSNPLLFVGQPFNQPNWGIDGGLPGTILTSSTPSSTPALLVMRIDFKEGPDDVWLWVNPPLLDQPSIDSADVTAPGLGDFSGITQVRADVGAGARGGSIIGTLDEIRIGYTFAAIAPVVPDSDCSQPSGLPGCSDPACEAMVCGLDPFCCEVAWDGACTELTGELCFAAGACDGAWTQINTQSTPPARYHHDMAYDSDHGVTVMYGGATNSNTLADTWEWNGTSWTQIAASGPGTLWNHKMAYDPINHKVVLFGGSAFYGNSTATWEYDTVSNAWTYKTNTGPAPRNGHAMAFDPKRGSIILYGGIGNSSVFGDTWEWKNGAWTQLAVTGPPNRGHHAMALDPSRNTLVVFGGDLFNSYYGDTWEWDGATSTWTQRSSSGPSARFYHDMAPAGDCGGVLLFGGMQPPATDLSDLWVWNGDPSVGAWTQKSLSAPSVRLSPAIAYDEAAKKLLLFGGQTYITGALNDTWQWTGPTLTLTTQPLSQAVATGGCVTLTVAATGNGLSYAWFKNGVPVTNGGSISGATTASLTICPASAADAGSYGVLVSDACCSAKLSSAAMLLVQTPGDCLPPPSGLKHWWSFDELPGAVTVKDIAGGTTGVLHGAILAPGMVDNAMDLDGVNDYASVGGLPFQFNAQFTIDCWIHPTAASGGVILAKESIDSFGQKRGFVLELAGSTLGWGWGDGGTSGIYNGIFGGTATVPLNQWSLVAVVVDRSTAAGTVTLYLNGTAVTSVPASILGNINNSANLVIGKAPDYAPPSGFFPGAIDEVEIFDRALSLAEIQALSIAGPGGKCKLHCSVPPLSILCLNQLSVTTTVTVCNDSVNQQTYSLSFAGVNCGGPMLGPSNFTVLNGLNPVTVWPGGCVSVPVKITPSFFSLKKSCYTMTMTNVANGDTASASGAIKRKFKWCFGNWFGQLAPFKAGQIGQLTFDVTNDADPDGMVDYVISVLGADGAVDGTFVALGGGEPGLPLTGSIALPIGETASLTFDVMFVEAAPLSLFNVVLAVDEGDGEGLDPVASIAIQSSSCLLADLDCDGVVNGSDLGIMLGQWGSCAGCIADLDANGVVDGADLGMLLASWS